MKTVGLLLLSFILILVGFEPAAAGWCARKTSYNEEESKAAGAEAFRVSSAVFSGEVTEKNQTQVTFKVAKVWKGTVAVQLMVSSEYYVKEKGESFITSCASSFEIGKSYLVYSDLFENQLQVHECSRTQLSNQAEHDLKILGKLSAQGDAQPLFGFRPTQTFSVNSEIQPVVGPERASPLSELVWFGEAWM